ncbi:DedA family protein [Dermabacteraceae bacterium P13136]
MKDFIESLPFELAFLFLYGVIILRAGGTYLLGRGAISLANRGRVQDFLNSPRVVNATEKVNLYGAPLVALSFLTVGFQTAANAAAGVTRMPYVRYIPALLIGGAAWAFIYATVGLAAFWLMMQNPLMGIGILAAALLICGGIYLFRRSRGRI